MNYQRLILTRLLEKYEDSRHFYGDARVDRKVALKFNRKQFPWYDLENVESKEAVHFAVKNLMERSIIKLKWMRFEKGNILEEVSLNLEQLEMAYQLAGRKPKEDSLLEVLSRLKEINKSVQTPWIEKFFKDCIEHLENTKSLPKHLPREEELCHLFLSALEGIDQKGSDEMLERVFSRKYLGGSKELERKVRSRLVSVIKEFFPLDNDLEGEEVLEHVGILKTSEDLLFRGPLGIDLLQEKLSYAPFVFGASMNTETIKKFEVRELAVKKVITIENKASYLSYIKNHDGEMELAVYLAGFYSPVKKMFLEKIWDFVRVNSPETEFFHWGDIDLGGFKIFLQVQKLIPQVQPFLMDVDTLRKYTIYGDQINNNYREKLAALLGKPEYYIFYPAIKEMLRLGIKLEQEAIEI
ncbi:MAG: DUF2220 family protein [Desulfitobacteriaceae bacterium]|nr:DUF2220 family protein [Desulfitobacteriaceae bacterium]